MTGIEVAIATGVARVLIPKDILSFFTKWKLDITILRELFSCLNSVESLLNAANKMLINDDQVNKWVKDARLTIYDADDFLDMILVDLPGSKPVRDQTVDLVETNDSIWHKAKYMGKNIGRSVHHKKTPIAQQMKMLTQLLHTIVQEKDPLNLEMKDTLSLYRKTKKSTSSSCTFHEGSNDMKEVISLLNSHDDRDEELRVVTIVGLGGVGKTSLAAAVFGEYDTSSLGVDLPGSSRFVSRFLRTVFLRPRLLQVKGWVWVSDDFDEERVIRDLLVSIGNPPENKSNLEQLQSDLKKQLKGRKFLIVLDDVWSDISDKWRTLKSLFSVGAPGSRVLVTSRDRKVVKIVRTTRNGSVYHLKVLPNVDCWPILEKCVFPDMDSHLPPKVQEIGVKLAATCCGLPLAITTLGKELQLKECQEDQWNHILSADIWKRRDTEVMESLWLSYVRLPDPVKHCFAYFSTFPKSHPFSRDTLVKLWLAEGFVKENKEAEAIGYFNDLASIFFIQQNTEGENEPWSVHDLVHNLAMDVSLGLCFKLDDPKSRSRRLSYSEEEEERLRTLKPVDMLSRVRTFLPLSPTSSRTVFNMHVRSSLLPKFDYLRVLSLRGYVYYELPSSVCGRKLLKYLDLSETSIKSLPDALCKLSSLRTLLLCRCMDLHSLPASICELVDLSYISIVETTIKGDEYGLVKRMDLEESYGEVWAVPKGI